MIPVPSDTAPSKLNLRVWRSLMTITFKPYMGHNGRIKTLSKPVTQMEERQKKKK
jgi:hypothetical protein